MILPYLQLLAVAVVAFWILRWLWAFTRAAILLRLLVPGDGQQNRRGLYRIIVSRDEYDHGPGDPQPFKFYRPVKRATGPAVIIYHGATPYGEEHATLDTLAQALAKVGFLVFIPRLPQLMAVTIDKSNQRSMITFYHHIRRHPSVQPGRITVVGTSYAGGLMLKALLEPEMRAAPPRAVLTYGSYCDLERGLKFVLTGRAEDQGRTFTIKPDPWGQILFFYNYLDHVPGKFDRESVRAVLKHYANDRHEAGAAVRDQLPERERRMADLLLNPGDPESLVLAGQVLEHAHSLLAEDSPSHFYRQIDFPIWVMHGRNDVAVHYTEALALKRLLPKKVRLLITDLYGHKEISLVRGLGRNVKYLLVMVLFLGRFLRAVAGRR
ncbi:MAG: alpha/beta hydrolase [Candidatus Neomarinimicrobiota bacterium]